MSAHWLEIDAKHRRPVQIPAALADFTVRRGDEEDPSRALHDPTLSLYSLERERGEAIFVELPESVDLTAAPFAYRAQYEGAQRLLAVPLDTFLELAERLPDPRELIAVYSTGRSGSTLLSRLFGGVDGVLSLSEPDVIERFSGLGDDAVSAALVRSCVRFLAKPTPFAHGAALAIKFRTGGVQAMERVADVFPNVRSLFSYRDAVSWTESFYRLFKRLGVPYRQPWEEALAWPRESFGDNLLDPERFLDRSSEGLPMTMSMALVWLTAIDRYLEHHARGVPALALRYRDLNAHPEAVTAALLEHCGLPASALSDALQAFARDSQEGTPLERARPEEEPARLNAEQIAEIEAVVARHPIVERSDFTVPGTLEV